MKMKMLIINKTQFGYHTDVYKICQILSNEFDIQVLCFDTKKTKINVPNVAVKYVPSVLPKYLRALHFIAESFRQISLHKGIIFLVYFENCEILKKFMPQKKMILDIRTLCVEKDQLQRERYDRKLKRATDFFDHITVISAGVISKLKISESKAHLLPLGADIISRTDKTFDTPRLLYVGTLYNRNISETIKGFAKFCDNHPTVDAATFDIVGGGAEYEDLMLLVTQLNLENKITFHGHIAHNKLQPFFDKCNIGISYVPITEYFNFQPPTKTYEYILAGMVCVATSTYENSQLINPTNGILCEDKVDSFSDALAQVYNSFSIYNSKDIRNTLIDNTWTNIVNNNLVPYLKKITDESPN